MRKLLLILPFALVLGMLAGTMRVLAVLGDVSYRPYNPDAEGARILEHRARLLQGDYPPGYDIYFAGTSRTLADFAPSTVAQVLNRRCTGGQAITGYNLGNVADEYGPFFSVLRRVGPPRLLVLELMPTALLEAPTRREHGGAQPTDWMNNYYRDYRNDRSIFEAHVTGWLRGALGLQDLINVRPGQLLLLARLLLGADHRAARLYYMLRDFQGNGAQLTELGQALYRSYLPDRHASELAGDSASEYVNYTRLLRERASKDAWDDFVRILDLFGNNRQVLVVRLPVDPSLYQLEESTHGDMMKEAARYLRSRGIAYFDFNPATYRSTDLSHLDWYETEQFSRDFAQRLAGAIQVGVLGQSLCR